MTTVDNPAYDTDPDKANNARVSFTWTPRQSLSTMISYGRLTESRDELTSPLAGGKREAERDQALASVTVLLGNRSSVTASYAYYKNKIDHTVSWQDDNGAYMPEPGVPYDDTAHVGSVAVTFVPVDSVNLSASASRSYSTGSFSAMGSGTVTNVADIAGLTDIKIIDSVYDAGIEIEHERNINSELRYQYRRYDDQIDDAQDGTVKVILATLALKW
jgi:outer membrane receptor protein involved in Fe transport